MSLVAVRYVDKDDRTSVNVIEDWHLPTDAFKTQFKDAAGRTLYLIGTKESIAKECARLDKPGASALYHGHEFKFAGTVAAPKPAKSLKSPGVSLNVNKTSEE